MVRAGTLQQRIALLPSSATSARSWCYKEATLRPEERNKDCVKTMGTRKDEPIKRNLRLAHEHDHYEDVRSQTVLAPAAGFRIARVINQIGGLLDYRLFSFNQHVPTVLLAVVVSVKFIGEFFVLVFKAH